jgi:hypothetical protein
VSWDCSSFYSGISIRGSHYHEDKYAVETATSTTTTVFDGGHLYESTDSKADVTTEADVWSLGGDNRYESGSYQDQSWDLHSVTYLAASAQTTMLHREVQTTSDYAASGATGTSVTTENSHSTGDSDYRSSGLSTSSLERRGVYQNGYYTYPTFNTDTHTSGNATLHAEGTSDWTKTVSGNTTSGHDSFVLDADQHRSYRHIRTGSLDAGTLTWNSATLNGSSGSNATFHAQGHENGSGTDWSSNSTYVFDEVDHATSGIHIQGQFANNSWSFSSYASDVTESSVGTYHEDGDDWTHLSGQIWGPNGPEPGGPTSDRWRTYRIDHVVTTSHSLHKAGTFANSNFSYTSYVLDDATTDRRTSHDQGTWVSVDSSGSSNGCWVNDEVRDDAVYTRESGSGSQGTRTIDTFHLFDRTEWSWNSVDGAHSTHVLDNPPPSHQEMGFGLPGTGLEGWIYPIGWPSAGTRISGHVPRLFEKSDYPPTVSDLLGLSPTGSLVAKALLGPLGNDPLMPFRILMDIGNFAVANYQQLEEMTTDRFRAKGPDGMVRSTIAFLGAEFYTALDALGGPIPVGRWLVDQVYEATVGTDPLSYFASLDPEAASRGAAAGPGYGQVVNIATMIVGPKLAGKFSKVDRALSASRPGIPKTGIARYDQLAVESPHFQRFIRGVCLASVGTGLFSGSG